MIDDLILKAAVVIKNGGVVAFPTETVYGIGADARNNLAVQSIFALKNRPAINPLIVHVANIEQAEEIGIFNPAAYKLAGKFWPGALTIILPLRQEAKIGSACTAGLHTIALRIPRHEVARQLITLSGVPIAAPSANPSGYISATKFVHAQKHFAQSVYVLPDDNTTCSYGIESTIIDLTSSKVQILRYGGISLTEIASVLEISEDQIGSHNLTSVKAPGMLLKHYAPITNIRKDAIELGKSEVGLNFGAEILFGNHSLNLSPSGDLKEAAKNLYTMLRELDDYALLNSNIKGIAVASIPEIGIGIAINDKLCRATYRY